MTNSNDSLMDFFTYTWIFGEEVKQAADQSEQGSLTRGAEKPPFVAAELSAKTGRPLKSI